MYVLANMWFQKLMRQFFFSIDKIVYSFISSIYNLLISIARTSILSQADIIDMTNKIYKLLAVFMVFKVTFSLIMYVVNPDDFSDKSKGASKLVTNIVISLSLLILTPYIFSYAYQIQTIILEDNALATLIFGTENGNIGGEDSSFLNDAGDKMAYITMSPFFVPNTADSTLYNCVILTENNNGNVTFSEECKSALSDAIPDNDDMVNNYVTGIEASNLGLMFRQDLAIATIKNNNDSFVMDYKYIFSTVIGVVIILLLVTFCMDVAVRSIKLAFYQLIAPIPILSYVDPKGGKDGMFKKWYQACFKTFLSLFVRLLALYFALYIISRINSLTDIIDGTTQSNMLIKIFIIIGALMFAKQLPKILEGLGIKLDDAKFTLNPLKKIENDAIGGKQIRNATRGALAGGLAGAAAFGTNLLMTPSRVKNAKGFGKIPALFSSVGGGVSAARRGFASGLKGEKLGKSFTNSYSGAMKAKHDRAVRNQQGINPFVRAGYKLNQAMGGLNFSEKIKNQVEQIESGNGDEEGFTDALKQKYGEDEGQRRSERIRNGKYYRKSNKELETDKKTLQAKKTHIGAVLDSKKSIEALAPKSRTASLEREIQSIESRSDADYIDGKYGKLQDKFELWDPNLRDEYNASTTSESRKKEILGEIAAKAREADRKRAKKELDTAIASSIVKDLKDPNASTAVKDLFAELRSSVMSTEDENLRKAFDSFVEMAPDENGKEQIVFKRFKRDADGKVKFETKKDENGKTVLVPEVDEDIKRSDYNSDEEYDIAVEQAKVQYMMDVIDAFGDEGQIKANAKRVNSSIQSEASEIDDILDGRSVQSSELQNSEKARNRAAVSSSIGSK